MSHAGQNNWMGTKHITGESAPQWQDFPLLSKCLCGIAPAVKRGYPRSNSNPCSLTCLVAHRREEVDVDRQVRPRLHRRVEQFCRYLLRPPVAQDRLRLTGEGRVLLELKSELADGTRHLLFEPLEFLEKLAALITRGLAEMTRLGVALGARSGCPPTRPLTLCRMYQVPLGGRRAGAVPLLRKHARSPSSCTARSGSTLRSKNYTPYPSLVI